LLTDDIELLDFWIKANAPDATKPEAVRRLVRLVAMRLLKSEKPE
jgi:hypothetical protein